MRTLKNIVIGLFVIIIVLFLISFFLPSKVHVERSSVINATQDAVFNEVNDLKKWKGWTPYHQTGSDVKINFGDTTSGENASYTWTSNSNQSDNGSVKIIESTPNRSITALMNFMGQNGILCRFRFDSSDGTTQMKWSIEANMGWNPLQKFFGLTLDNYWAAYCEKGMKNLDSVLINRPKSIPEIFTSPDTTATGN